MEAENNINQKRWEVILKIKKKDLINHWSSLGKVSFGLVTEDEWQILLWLKDVEAINIIDHTYSRRLSLVGDINQLEETKIEIIQPKFDEVYKLYEDNYALMLNSANIKPAINKKMGSRLDISEIIKTKKIKGKEKIFLQCLANTRAISFSELESKTGTKNLKSLKMAVLKKLKKTEWSIDTIRELGKDSFYKLYLLTEKNNSN